MKRLQAGTISMKRTTRMRRINAVTCSEWPLKYMPLANTSRGPTAGSIRALHRLRNSLRKVAVLQTQPLPPKRGYTDSCVTLLANTILLNAILILNIIL